MRERPEEQLKVTNLLDEAKKWSPSQPVYSLSGSRDLVSQMKAQLGGRQDKGAGSGFFLKDGLPFGGVKGLDPSQRPEPDPELAGQLFGRPAQTKTPQPEIRLPRGYDPSKKKNAGGLSAARRHMVPDFFPGQLDQMKLGPVRIQPIAFKNASPQINLRSVAYSGFPKSQS